MAAIEAPAALEQVVRIDVHEDRLAVRLKSAGDEETCDPADDYLQSDGDGGSSVARARSPPSHPPPGSVGHGDRETSGQIHFKGDQEGKLARESH